MSQTQEITVSTKGGLIAAFECAKQNGFKWQQDPNHPDPGHTEVVQDQTFDTLITLRRKSGNTTFFCEAGVLNKVLDRAKRLTKRIPAKELLA